MTRRVPFGLGAAMLGLPVLLLGLLVIGRHSFDGLYGQDAFGYATYALGPLRDALLRLEPPPPFFWPPGYPLLVLGASLAGAGVAAGQITSLVAGTLMPGLVALLAREALRPFALPGNSYALPLLAGAAVALTGQLWQSSVVGMSDTASAAAAVLGAYCACRYVDGGRTWALVLSAMAFALAIETRWIYGLVALPFALLCLAHGARTFGQRGRAVLTSFGLATAAGLVVGSPTLVPLINALLSGSPLPFVGDFNVYRWDLFGAAASVFDTPDGRLAYGLPTGVFYALQPFQHYWLGILAMFAPAGLWAVWRGRSSVTAISIVVLMAWPGLVLGFLFGGAYQNTRFFLAALPPVAILVALGVGMLISAATGHRLVGRLPARPAVLWFVGVALLINASLAARFSDAFVVRVTADVASVHALADRVPNDARLISLGATAALRHAGRDGVVELSELDEHSAPVLVGDGQPTYVLVDIDAIRTQWAGRPADAALTALDSQFGLSLVGSAGIWSLYVVL